MVKNRFLDQCHSIITIPIYLSGLCDFETAIKATEFGKFNVLLIFLALPVQWALYFEVVTMSYVFPVAQCDLELSLAEKGTLNALCFAGMVASGLMWGFLCDAIGRRQVLIAGEFLDATFVFISAFSQNYAMLAATKFFGGFVINGTLAAISSYLAEFHSVKYRARVQLVRGLFTDGAMISLASLAWIVIPSRIKYESKHMTLHSWNFFLMVSTLAPLTAGLVSCFMPESPKFLMTLGRSDEALEILRKVYAVNTGRPKDSYPVTKLKAERHRGGFLEPGDAEMPLTKKQALIDECYQLKRLFGRQYAKNLTLGCAIFGLSFFCVNTVKLWLPQIFQSLNDHFLEHKEKGSLCEALHTLNLRDSGRKKECVVTITDTVYINTMILSCVAIAGHLLSLLVVQKLGKKTLFVILAIASTACTVGLYFCGSVTSVLATASLFITFVSIGSNLLMSAVMEMFPTPLRAITLSVVLLFGRGMSMFGNFLFPFLLRWDCAVPIFTLASLLFVSTILVLFVPNTENQALK